jgi:hypothetical protein
MALIKNIDLSKAWVTYQTFGFGINMYVLFHPQYPMPLGFVWGTAHGGKINRFEVMGSYTEIFFRRLGVRSKINEEIHKTFSLISSSGASKSGKKFMKASGYKYSEALSQWYTRKK